MTEKQIWARKRNWLIRRLKGAESIFSYDNMIFMQEATRDIDSVYRCINTIDRLIKVMKESKYKET